ncbi:hypothetical protein EU528_03020 [Candidatus Thorarchaeota archaeon]|nr:MAG: hypothetical protein EU528_03020 [Candidatus Thorarchaeota archaeon]
MKRVSLLVIACLFVVSLSSMTLVDGAIGLQWSFEEGDFINYRFISDGMVEDEIISFRIDSPLPEWCELPPDTYNLGALDDWMEIPLVTVTGFIPFGSSTTEVDGFENIFTYGGLAAGYWCRFAVPSGISNDTYASLVEGWTDGPHGTIETHIVQPDYQKQYTYWGFEYGFEFSDTIYNVTAWYFAATAAMGRLANVTILGHDSITEEQTHHLMMVTDYHVPTISSPSDLNFTVGTTDVEIRWASYDNGPYGYEVFRNDTLFQSGDLDLYHQSITISLDGLDVGVWNYTVVITDFLLNSVSDTVIVTVKSSSILSPEILLIVGGVGAVLVVGVVVMKRRG